MSENKEEIWYILKFYYKERKNATQAKQICDVYGHDAVLRGHKVGLSVLNLKILIS